MPERLRFYCRQTALVEDVHAANRDKPLRRMIGRRWQEVLPGRWAWVPTGEAQEVDYHADLVKACQEGDLWPADEATAKACGVPFSEAFDDETTESIKAFKARLAAASAPPAKVETKDDKKAGAAGGKGDS